MEPLKNKTPETRKKPFTEHYPKWDAPTFDPAKYYLTPKKQGTTSNTSVMSRIYEDILEKFRDAREKGLKRILNTDVQIDDKEIQRILNTDVDIPEEETVQVDGNLG